MSVKVALCGVAGAGKHVLVDEDDLHLVDGIKWYATVHKHTPTVYARGKDDQGNYSLIHRLIMQPPKGMVVDHIDGDGLNNTRANLRICTHRENLIFGIDRRERVKLDAIWAEWQDRL